MIKEFRAFILRGNLVDLAVAVVIGTAFAAVVTALVTDLITPLLAAIGGKQDFSALTFAINGSEFRYGDFINALITFVTIAAVVFFFVVKPVNALLSRMKTEQDVEEETRRCPECRSSIPVSASRCAFCTAAGAPGHGLSFRDAVCRLPGVSMYDLVRDLPVEIEGHRLRGHEMAFSPEFSRLTTEVELYGGGESGVGEDVTYTGLDHIAFQAEGAGLPLAGSYTIGSFSDHLGEIDLFPTPPEYPDSRRYRRWAVESAALDLALRQAGRSLADVLGREARPLNFVVSMRLSSPGDDGPETADRLLRAPRALSRHALQARPHEHLDPGAGGRAGRHRARWTRWT